MYDEVFGSREADMYDEGIERLQSCRHYGLKEIIERSKTDIELVLTCGMVFALY